MWESFVSGLWQVGDFLCVLLVSSTNKTANNNSHDMTEILLTYYIKPHVKQQNVKTNIVTFNSVIMLPLLWRDWHLICLVRPQSGVLILVASWPSTPNIWWPAGHQLQTSGGQAQILVAKVKKIGSQIYKVIE